MEARDCEVARYSTVRYRTVGGLSRRCGFCTLRVPDFQSLGCLGRDGPRRAVPGLDPQADPGPASTPHVRRAGTRAGGQTLGLTQREAGCARDKSQQPGRCLKFELRMGGLGQWATAGSSPNVTVPTGSCPRAAVTVTVTVSMCWQQCCHASAGRGVATPSPRNLGLLVLVPVPWSLGRATSRRTRPRRTLPIQSWPAGGPGRARAHGGPGRAGGTRPGRSGLGRYLVE